MIKFKDTNLLTNKEVSLLLDVEKEIDEKIINYCNNPIDTYSNKIVICITDIFEKLKFTPRDVVLQKLAESYCNNGWTITTLNSEAKTWIFRPREED